MLNFKIPGMKQMRCPANAYPKTGLYLPIHLYRQLPSSVEWKRRVSQFDSAPLTLKKLFDSFILSAIRCLIEGLNAETGSKKRPNRSLRSNSRPRGIDGHPRQRVVKVSGNLPETQMHVRAIIHPVGPGFKAPGYGPTYQAPSTREEAAMAGEELKKILAGFCIAGLIAGSTFTLGGCAGGKSA
jgi:radical SAM modification target selenobiotic family peptide